MTKEELVKIQKSLEEEIEKAKKRGDFTAVCNLASTIALLQSKIEYL